MAFWARIAITVILVLLIAKLLYGWFNGIHGGEEFAKGFILAVFLMLIAREEV